MPGANRALRHVLYQAMQGEEEEEESAHGENLQQQQQQQQRKRIQRNTRTTLKHVSNQHGQRQQQQQQQKEEDEEEEQQQQQQQQQQQHVPRYRPRPYAAHERGGRHYVLRVVGYRTLSDLAYTLYYIHVSVEDGEDVRHGHQTNSMLSVGSPNQLSKTLGKSPSDSILREPPLLSNFEENTSPSRRSWHISKRYSQFRALRDDLSAVQRQLPPLPTKKIFGNLRPKFVSERAKGLNTFLWTLASSPLLCDNYVVHRFLTSDVCRLPSNLTAFGVTTSLERASMTNYRLRRNSLTSPPMTSSKELTSDYVSGGNVITSHLMPPGGSTHSYMQDGFSEGSGALNSNLMTSMAEEGATMRRSQSTDALFVDTNKNMTNDNIIIQGEDGKSEEDWQVMDGRMVLTSVQHLQQKFTEQGLVLPEADDSRGQEEEEEEEEEAESKPQGVMSNSKLSPHVTSRSRQQNSTEELVLRPAPVITPANQNMTSSEDTITSSSSATTAAAVRARRVAGLCARPNWLPGGLTMCIPDTSCGSGEEWVSSASDGWNLRPAVGQVGNIKSKNKKKLKDGETARLKARVSLRFVIVLVGSRGDVQPYVALGVGLKAQGHTVRIAAHSCFRSFIEQYGLEFAPVAGDPKELLKMVTENSMFSIKFVKEGVTTHRKWISEILYDSWDACTLPLDRLRLDHEPPRTRRFSHRYHNNSNNNNNNDNNDSNNDNSKNNNDNSSNNSSSNNNNNRNRKHSSSSTSSTCGGSAIGDGKEEEVNGYQRTVAGRDKIGQGPGFAFAARHSDFRADVVIANPPAFSGWHLAEALGVPLFMSFPMPWSRTVAFPSPFTTSSIVSSQRLNWMSFGAVDRLMWLGSGDIINRWRVSALKLEPIWTLSARGHRIVHDNQVPHLYPWSPSLLPKPNDWGTHLNITGYWFLDEGTKHNKKQRIPTHHNHTNKSSRTHNEQQQTQQPSPAAYKPPPSLAAFLAPGTSPRRERMPVFIGFGSIVVKDPLRLSIVLTRTIAQLLVHSRVVLQQGWAAVNVDVTSIPLALHSRLLVIGEAQHRWLFERCAVLVHHGGAGTTAEGLRAGKPTVVVPFFGDQFFWGRNVEDRGLGSCVPYVGLTPQRLLNAILAVLSPSVLARARQVGGIIRRENGVDKAIQVIYRHLPRFLITTAMHHNTVVRRCTEGAEEDEAWVGVDGGGLEGGLRWGAVELDWRRWPYAHVGDEYGKQSSAPSLAINAISKRVGVVGTALGSALKQTVAWPIKGVGGLLAMTGSTVSENNNNKNNKDNNNIRATNAAAAAVAAGIDGVVELQNLDHNGVVVSKPNCLKSNGLKGRTKDRTENEEYEFQEEFTKRYASSGINSWVQRNRLFEMHAATGAKRALAKKQSDRLMEPFGHSSNSHEVPYGHTSYSWFVPDGVAAAALPGHTPFSLGL